MKGVILAGGNGTRLLPLTKNSNKHMLPIYNRLMIEYPLRTLLKAGIKEILIVTGREHIQDFIEYLGYGEDYGAIFSYVAQNEAGGTAQALSLARNFARAGSLMVILGDQIFENDFSKSVKNFKKGARLFLKKVKNPQRFSVPILDNKLVVGIVEKPITPPSPYAVTGVFLYDQDIFKILKQLKKSVRGELEITDANTVYIKRKMLDAEILRGFWIDAGTFESLSIASVWSAKKNKK